MHHPVLNLKSSKLTIYYRLILISSQEPHESLGVKTRISQELQFLTKF